MQFLPKLLNWSVKEFRALSSLTTTLLTDFTRWMTSRHVSPHKSCKLWNWEIKIKFPPNKKQVLHTTSILLGLFATYKHVIQVDNVLQVMQNLIQRKPQTFSSLALEFSYPPNNQQVLWTWSWRFDSLQSCARAEVLSWTAFTSTHRHKWSEKNGEESKKKFCFDIFFSRNGSIDSFKLLQFFATIRSVQIDNRQENKINQVKFSWYVIQNEPIRKKTH